MLDRALTRFGFNVLTAPNAAAGMAVFDAERIDVVVTDLLMPGLDGTDVLNHVRRSIKKNTPVIAMSGTPSLLGVHDFDVVLPKPFSIYELLHHAKNACPDAGVAGGAQKNAAAVG